MPSQQPANLYPQSDWDHGYRSAQFRKPPPDDHVAQWMRKVISKSGRTKGSCFEVGCFPGGYLSLCGDLGFELNGIDLTPRVDTSMVEWLKRCGYQIGHIQQADFFAMDESRRFDLVYSNGFIEHFPDWKPVLKKKANLVAPGGLLLVTAPNFVGGAQHFLHRILDDVNLSKHYLPSMNPDLWVDELKDDFEVLSSGFFHEFHFWIGEQNRSLAQKLGFWSLRAMTPALSRLFPKNSPSFAPYCGVAARRKV